MPSVLFGVTLQGTVRDYETNLPVVGVTVLLEGPATLVKITDQDGFYSFPRLLSEKTYKMKLVLPGYISLKDKVVIQSVSSDKKDDTTTDKVEVSPIVRNYHLKIAYEALPSTITSSSAGPVTVINNSESALTGGRKHHDGFEDGISFELSAQFIDDNVANTAVRIPGVHTTNGDSIHVRGLGRRYSTLYLNNFLIGSVDPDTKGVISSIFPIYLIDNVIVNKIYSPDKMGEFSGGTVNIHLSEYIDKKELNLIFVMGFNTMTSFRSFQTYDGNRLDSSGLSSFDSNRRLPSDLSKQIAQPLDNDAKFQTTQLFANNNIWNIQSKSALPQINGIVQYTDQHVFSPTSNLSYFVSLLFRELSQNRVEKKDAYNTSGALLSTETSNLSAYQTTYGLALSSHYWINKQNKLNFVAYSSHNSSNNAVRTFVESDLDGATREDLLHYIGQGFLLLGIDGTHSIDKSHKLGWDFAYSRSTRDEPDKRESNYHKGAVADSYLVRQFHRDYNLHIDSTYNGSIHWKFDFRQWDQFKSHFKTGVNYLYRNRDNLLRSFLWEISDSSQFSSNVLTNDAESVFKSILDGKLIDGVRFIENNDAGNRTQSIQSIYAYFFQLVMPLTRKIHLSTGARFEYSQLATGLQPLSLTNGANKPNFSDYDILPSIIVSYTVIENVKLKTSYSHSMARPDYREFGSYVTTSAVTGNTIFGNSQLVKSNIDNVDIRFEWYFGLKDFISISGYYKDIKNPIEELPIISTNNVYTFFNADRAHVYGVEIEGRYRFDQLLPLTWGDIYLTSNLTLGSSRITFPSIISYEEINNPDISTTITSSLLDTKRRLQGQPSYIINASINYAHQKYGTLFSMIFHTTGRYITRVGLQGFRNQIEQERAYRLGVSITQRLYDTLRMRFILSNLLDPAIAQTTILPGSTTRQVVYEYKQGRNLHIALSYVF